MEVPGDRPKTWRAAAMMFAGTVPVMGERGNYHEECGVRYHRSQEYFRGPPS